MPRRENQVLFAIDLKWAGGGGSGGILGAGGNVEVSLLMEEMIEFVLSGVLANRIISLPTSVPAPCRAVGANLQMRPLIFVPLPPFFSRFFPLVSVLVPVAKSGVGKVSDSWVTIDCGIGQSGPEQEEMDDVYR